MSQGVMMLRGWILLLACSAAVCGAGPAAELDLRELLLGSQPLNVGQVSGPIWTARPDAGRTLVLLPVRLREVDAAIELDPSHFNLSGGRFIAWQIPAPRHGEDAPLLDRDGNPLMNPAPVGGGTLRLSVPRLTRSLELLPGKKIRWKVTRAFPDATSAKAGEAYGLLLNRSMLKRPQRTDPNYRQQLDTYVQTTKLLSRLPTKFVEPAPETLWAIYAIRSNPRKLKIDGEAPLPWEIPFDRFQQLRSLGGGHKPEIAEPAVEKLANSEHVFDRRLAAYLLASGYYRNAEIDSPLGQIALQLLDDADAATRRAVIDGAAALPESPPTVPLLKKALQDAEPSIAFSAIQLLHQRLASPSGQRLPAVQRTELIGAMAAAIARLLGRPDGIETAQGLQTLYAVSSISDSAGLEAAGTLDLKQIDDSRRAHLIKAVVEDAFTGHRVANHLLARCLLSTEHTAYHLDTLQAIAQAQSKAHLPIRDEKHGLLHRLSASDPKLRQAAWKALPRFELSAPAPPNGRADPAVTRSLYASFAKAAARTDPMPSAAVDFLVAQSDAASRLAAYSILLDHDTQTDTEVRAQVLRRVLAEGPNAAVQLLQNLSGPQRQNIAELWYAIEPPLPGGPPPAVPAVVGLLRAAELTADDDVKEDAQGDAEPAEAGTPKAPKPSKEILEWFAAQMIAGYRPHPREWARMLDEDPDQYVGWTALTDSHYARALSAAVVSMAVWPDAERLDQFMLAAESKAAQFKDRATIWGKMREYWRQTGPDWAQRRLEQAAGEYRMFLRLLPPAGSKQGARTFDLHKRSLVVNDLNATMPNTPITGAFGLKPLVLRLTTVRDVAKLKTADEKPLPKIDWPDLPFDLLPYRADGWRGQLLLPDGSTAQITLLRHGM